MNEKSEILKTYKQLISSKEELKMILSAFCCDSGKDFCSEKTCPLFGLSECNEQQFSKEQLIKAAEKVKVLIDNSIN